MSEKPVLMCLFCYVRGLTCVCVCASYLPRTPGAHESTAAGAHVGPDAAAAIQARLFAASWRRAQQRM